MHTTPCLVHRTATKVELWAVQWCSRSQPLHALLPPQRCGSMHGMMQRRTAACSILLHITWNSCKTRTDKMQNVGADENVFAIFCRLSGALLRSCAGNGRVRPCQWLPASSNAFGTIGE